MTKKVRRIFSTCFDHFTCEATLIGTLSAEVDTDMRTTNTQISIFVIRCLDIIYDISSFYIQYLTLALLVFELSAHDQ